MIVSMMRTSLSGLPQDQLMQMETTCGTLLYELQIIWDEVGETDMDRDKMLLELEQECLEVYRRKVDKANKLRAQLKRDIADSEAELAAICSVMSEPPVHVKKKANILKEELNAILPQLEEMRKMKADRRKQFVVVLEQLHKISVEIGSGEHNSSKMVVDESDLSITRLEELQRRLESLQKEKAGRLKQVLDHLNTLNSLCLVLGMDFNVTVNEIHPTLDNPENSKNISNATIERMGAAIKRLRDVKLQRMQMLQDLATSMLELWNLMDTPVEEQQSFQNVTRNIAASEQEITEPNTLSLDFINYVEAEVARLEELKISKMKELIMKKKLDLEDVRRRTHIVVDSDSEMEIAIEAIESGAIDPCLVLEQIEIKISNVKEEAFGRKEILEKVEKWLSACSEESWLEEYNRDDNRYSAGKGAHLTLKRAEKARATVSKLPAMAEVLVGKTKAWEKERNISFTYDGVNLLSMLEEYTILRQEKELERRRQRDQKKLHGQLIAEQEALFGSKPSPSKQQQSAKKRARNSMGGPCGNRRFSHGGAMLQHPSSSRQDLLLSAKANRTRRADDGTPAATLSSVRRGLDVVGLQGTFDKGLSYNGRDTTEAHMTRKPFTPLSSAPKHPTTPSKPTTYINNAISSSEDENRVALPIQTPKTPKTCNMPMLMSTTPAPESRSIAFGKHTDDVDDVADEIEYSFEEKRAGFKLPPPREQQQQHHHINPRLL